MHRVYKLDGGYVLAWEDIIAQTRVKEVLKRGLVQNRVPHAYLFFGPYGVGKRATALELSKALQCKEGNASDPCDECTNCSRIGRMMHPDVRFFFPAPSDTPESDIADRTARLGQNPYETLDFVRRPTSKGGSKQVRYPIAFIHEQVRPIVDYKAFEGQYKVVVIVGAEALSEQTANAFLKILEEPSDRTVFVLITGRPDRLLPTILSRCQPVRFDPLPAETIETELISRAGLTADVAGPLARLADGSFSVALDLIQDEQAREFRGGLLPFMRSVYVNDTFDVLDQVDRLSKMSLEQVKLFLTLLLGWIRDLILVRELGPDAPIVNVDARDNLERFCANLGEARLDQMVDLVEEAIGLVSRNVRVQLVLTSLASGLRRSMLGRRTLPLTTPLADQLVTEVE